MIAYNCLFKVKKKKKKIKRLLVDNQEAYTPGIELVIIYSCHLHDIIKKDSMCMLSLSRTRSNNRSQCIL